MEIVPNMRLAVSSILMMPLVVFVAFKVPIVVSISFALPIPPSADKVTFPPTKLTVPPLASVIAPPTDRTISRSPLSTVSRARLLVSLISMLPLVELLAAISVIVVSRASPEPMPVAAERVAVLLASSAGK